MPFRENIWPTIGESWASYIWVGAHAGIVALPRRAARGKFSFLRLPPRLDLFWQIWLLSHPFQSCDEPTTPAYEDIARNLVNAGGYSIAYCDTSDIYYTMKEGTNMVPTKKATARPKRRIVAPAEKRTQLRLTVDSKFTKSHFSQLFAVLKIRRENALAEHIIMNFKTKAAQAQLVAFYNGPWLDIPFQSIDTSFVFPLTHDIADELERVGGEILGGVNNSKTFRVMVAYFAFVHKLKTPTHSMLV